MKTLAQEINEVKNANMSKTEKRNALMKLGLTSYEAMLVIPADKTERTEPFTFGVEIECGVRSDLLSQAAARTGFNYQMESYNHRDGQPHFKFVSDGSLRIDDSIECVSPILKGRKGQSLLKNACETLNLADAKVDRSCGLHVHIGAADLTGKQYANCFANYMHLERVIDSFMARSRRDNNNIYCKSLIGKTDLDDAETILDVRRAFSGRYFKLNPESYAVHKTIEFRQHGGTVNHEKIKNWVSFCGKMVNWSKKNRLTEDITSIDEIPFLNGKEKEYFKRRATELV